jgi:hypothetical protein
MLRPARSALTLRRVEPPLPIIPTGRAVMTQRHTIFEGVLGGRRVAFKAPHEGAVTPVLADRLFDLHHPHLVEHVAPAAPHGGIVLGWVDGLPMNEWCARSPVPACFAVWLDQGLDALSALHARGLCHTQISPSHLVVDEGGRLVIIGCSGVRLSMGRRDELLDLCALVRAVVRSYMGATTTEADETEELRGGLSRRGVRGALVTFVEEALRGRWGSACAMREVLLELDLSSIGALARSASARPPTTLRSPVTAPPATSNRRRRTGACLERQEPPPAPPRVPLSLDVHERDTLRVPVATQLAHAS